MTALDYVLESQKDVAGKKSSYYSGARDDIFLLFWNHPSTVNRRESLGNPFVVSLCSLFPSMTVHNLLFCNCFTLADYG